MPNPTETVRVQTVLQQAGLCSRRTAEDWVRAGRVTVNGVPAQIGQRVGRSDQVAVDGRPVGVAAAKQYWLLYKPGGYTTSLKDRHADHLVTELLPPGLGRLFPVGRLDRDSEGLLLMTNDGALAFALTHPRFGVEKVYEAWVKGVPRRHHLERIQRGIALEDGWARTESAQIVNAEGDRALLRLVLHEGKKREVRRIMEAVGHPVEKLTRVRFGGLTLEGLEPGQARPLTRPEVRELYALVRPEGAPHRSDAKHGQGSAPQGVGDHRRSGGMGARRSRTPVRHSRRNPGRKDG